MAQATDPDKVPSWVPAVVVGARRTGVLGPRDGFRELAARYAALLAAHPHRTAADLDAFFAGVAGMRGRELAPLPRPVDPIPDAVRAIRSRHPLRQRLSQQPEAQPHDGRSARDVFVSLRPSQGLLAATAAAANVPGSEVVTLTPAAADGLATIDEAWVPGLAADDEYTLLADVVAGMRTRYRVHLLEVPDLLAELGRPADEAAEVGFRGFCTDTFRFLGELAANNSRAWMDGQRDRYQFAVREPVVELCRELADRYVRVVLGGEYGWDMECDPRPGKAVTSIATHAYGRKEPYQPGLWLTFYPTAARNRAAAPQLFVQVEANGLTCGFRLGRAAREYGTRFRHAVREHGPLLFDALAATDAPADVRFGEEAAEPTKLASAADLRTWAAGRSPVASRSFAAADPVLRADELVGRVMLTFDRLVPLLAAALDADPVPVLTRRAGRPGVRGYDAAAFRRDTLLPETWLDRAAGLLKLKRQLVLQGVPGTGKTHVARCLARLLAKGRPDAVRFVQFHPAYGYAEFVESVSPNGDVTDGLLVELAGKAARNPAETFVLVVDDMTRANLPAVFGEALFLLEHRGQSVSLPFSRRILRLPENVYLIGTATAADPLAAPLRRRFGFVEMAPDADLLRRYFAAHPDPAFAARVVRLFEQLNARIARDLGPDRVLGHSLFMVPDLDAETLRTVWEHHVRPTLGPDAADRPDRLHGLDLDRWLAAVG